MVEAGRGARTALDLACEHLLGLQNSAGWWKGELQTNVTMDAEDLLLREFLGIREPEATARSAAFCRGGSRSPSRTSPAGAAGRWSRGRGPSPPGRGARFRSRSGN